MGPIPCVVYVKKESGEHIAVAYTMTYRAAKKVQRQVEVFWDYVGIVEAWNWPRLLTNLKWRDT